MGQLTISRDSVPPIEGLVFKRKRLRYFVSGISFLAVSFVCFIIVTKVFYHLTNWDIQIRTLYVLVFGMMMFILGFFYLLISLRKKRLILGSDSVQIVMKKETIIIDFMYKDIHSLELTKEQSGKKKLILELKHIDFPKYEWAYQQEPGEATKTETIDDEFETPIEEIREILLQKKTAAAH